MKSSNWKDIAELVGIGAIVASLVFVGVQLRQDQEIAEREIPSSFLANNIEIARLISDNEEVWRKGLQNEPLSESEQVTFKALVRVLYISRVQQFGRRRLSVHDGPDALEIPRTMAIYMYQYPGLKRGWISLDAKYKALHGTGATSSPGELLPLAMQFLAEIEKSQPTLPPPDFIVF